jgi:hypothetical protein
MSEDKDNAIAPELVTVRIEPASAQTLMDWNVLHFTDEGWTIDLDIWRTRPTPTPAAMEVVERLQKVLAFDFGDESDRCIELAVVAGEALAALQSHPADCAEVEKLREVARLADELVNGGGLVLTQRDGLALVVVENADKSDPHYRLCDALAALGRSAQPTSTVEEGNSSE